MKLKNRFYSLIGTLILVFCEIYSTQAQQDSVNVTDAQGWRQGRWTFYSEEGTLDACTKGIKIEEGFFKDNRKTGTWRKWWCSGKLRNELIYNSDKTIASKDYYPDGTLKEQGTWNALGWIGAYRFYYPNGKIYYEWGFDQNGKRTGQQKYYHENGNVMFDGEWNAGKENGVIKEYYENGTLRSEKTFYDGKLDTNSVKNFIFKEQKQPEEKIVKQPEEKIVNPLEAVGTIKDGFQKTYNRSGQIETEGEYKDAILFKGKRYYYKEGQLEKVGIVQNGKIVRFESAKELKNK